MPPTTRKDDLNEPVDPIDGMIDPNADAEIMPGVEIDAGSGEPSAGGTVPIPATETPSITPAPGLPPSIPPGLIQRAVATGMLTEQEAVNFPSADALSHTVRLLESKNARAREIEAAEAAAAAQDEELTLDLPADTEEAWDPRIKKNFEKLASVSKKQLKALAAENARIRAEVNAVRQEYNNARFDDAMDTFIDTLPDGYKTVLGKGPSRFLPRNGKEWQERLEVGKLILTMAESGAYSTLAEVGNAALRARYPNITQQQAAQAAQARVDEVRDVAIVPPTGREGASGIPEDRTARATQAVARKLRAFGVRPMSS